MLTKTGSLVYSVYLLIPHYTPTYWKFYFILYFAAAVTASKEKVSRDPKTGKGEH